MFIAILDLLTTLEYRSEILAQLESEQPTTTAMKGCESFRVFTQREEGTSITAIHEWDEESSFDAYLGSDAFARSGAVLRPLLAGPPLSRRCLIHPVRHSRMLR